MFDLFGTKKANMLSKMKAGVEAVKMHIFAQLGESFKEKYDAETAVKIAAAVTNALFFEERRPEHDDVYAKGYVAQEMKNLSSCEELKKAYTQAVQVLNHVSLEATGKEEPEMKVLKISTEEFNKRMDECLQCGLFIKKSPVPSFDEFMLLARECYERHAS